MQAGSSPGIREVRRFVASGLIGVFIAAFGTNIWLTYSYIGTRPRAPNPALGLMYPLNNHGAYYYLSATEAASVKLAFWCGWLTIILVFAVVPKDFMSPPPQTPRWVSQVSVRFKTGLEEFSLRYFIILVSTLVLSLAAIWLFGRDLSQLAAVYGLGSG